MAVPESISAPAPAEEGNKIPSQGFSGKPVAHEDRVTMTDDWNREYGKHHRTFEEICAEYPENEWCKVNGYHPTTTTTPPKKEEYKSHSSSLIILGVVVVALAVLVIIVMRSGA